ncbi:poly(A) polymerase catalytic subunit [Salmon gill poxvirus]
MKKITAADPYLHLQTTPVMSNKIQTLTNFNVGWITEKIITLHHNRVIPAYRKAAVTIKDNKKSMEELRDTFTKELEYLITPHDTIDPKFQELYSNHGKLAHRKHNLQTWISQLKTHMEPPRILTDDQVRENVENFFICPRPDPSTDRKNNVFAIIDFKHTLCKQLKWIVDNTAKLPDLHIKNKVIPSEQTSFIMTKVKKFMSEQGESHVQVKPFEWISVFMRDISLCIMAVDKHSVAHGSFLAGLLNEKCKYGDVDFYSPVGGLLLSSLSVIAYLVGLGDFNILAVPFIKNYITMKDQYNLGVFDCCVYTTSFLANIPTQSIGNFRTVDSVITLINMFRSSGVKDRRHKTYEQSEKVVVNGSVLLEHVIQKHSIDLKNIHKTRNQVMDVLQKRIIKENTVRNVVFDISKICPGFNTFTVMFGPGIQFVETCMKKNGEFSKTFNSILDEMWFETSDGHVYGTHYSLETEVKDDKITVRTCLVALWSLCIYMFLHGRTVCWNNLFIFCLSLTISDYDWDVDNISLLPRSKKSGHHSGWSLKSKTFYCYVGKDLNDPSCPFIKKENFIMTE